MPSQQQSDRSLAYGGKTTESCEKMRHPNMLSYNDGNGARHDIYIPARDYYKCNLHFVKQEWDELVKFPRWNNQTVPETDDITEDMDPDAFYSVTPAQYQAWHAAHPPTPEVGSTNSTVDKRD